MSNSSDSIKAILGYLTESQREDLIFSLVPRLKEPGIPQTLFDVVKSLGWEDGNLSLKRAMTPYCILMLQDESYHDQLLLVTASFGPLSDDFLIAHSIETMKSFINNNKYILHKDFDAKLRQYPILTEGNKDSTQVSVESNELISILKFSSRWQMTGTAQCELDFDTLCLFCTVVKTEEVAMAALKAILWGIKRMVKKLGDLIWEVIFCLINSLSPTYKKIGLILWLKFLSVKSNSSDNTSINEDMQKHIITESYWSNLRNGLISNLHEHRKYSISILQLSIQSIDSNFENKLMHWQKDEKDLYLQAWKRYVTLYEIIGIDTSLNQAREASGEMIGLLSTESKIPVPFTLSLLSMGFKLSMETVRKFAMNLVFAIPERNLASMKSDGYEFLTSVFLQFAMMASNFVVNKNFDNNSKGEYRCEFGENLSQFIVNCYKNLNTHDTLQLTTKLIALLAHNRELFDLPRVYISFGLLEGLKHNKINILETNQLNLLYNLFQAKSDGEVSNTTLQTINLRLLLFINPSKVSLQNILVVLTQFVHFNNTRTGVNHGWKILSLNLDQFYDYFNKFFTNDEMMNFLDQNYKNLDVELLVILLALICTKQNIPLLIPKVLDCPKINELLLIMAKSGLPFNEIFENSLIKGKCGELLNELGNGVLHTLKFYEDATEFINREDIFDELYWDKFDCSVMWNIVIEGLGTTDENELRMATSQMKFLVDVVGKSIYNEFAETTISLTNFKELQDKAFQNIPRNAAIDLYKLKYLFWSRFYQIMLSFTKIVDIDSVKRDIFDMIGNDVEFLDKDGKLSVVRVMQKIFDELVSIQPSDSRILLSILQSIWTDITTERLVLGERELQIGIIKLLLHGKNILNSLQDEEISSVIVEFSLDIIDKCQSRKGLLPVMAEMIEQYQVDHAEEFENSMWISKIVVKMYSLLQIENNVFRSEYVIGDLFDLKLSFYYGKKLYKEVYGNEEIASRVNIAVMLGSLKHSDAAEYLWNYILNNDDEFHLLIPKNRADGYEETRRIRLLQLLLLTIKTVSTDYLYDIVMEKFLQSIFKEQSPLCRMYLEWIVAYTLLLSDLLKRSKLLENFETRVVESQQQTIVASFERISYLLARQLSTVGESEFLSKFLVEFLLPSCTSNRSLIRHFSVSLVVSIYPEIEERQLKFDKSLVGTISQIYQNALRTKNYKSYRSGDALLWDIEKDFTLVGICGGVMLRISDREVEFINEAQFIQYSTPLQRKHLQLEVGKDETNLFLSHDLRIQKPVLDSIYIDKSDNDSSTTALQTKSGAWSTVMNVDVDDDDENESKKVKRSPLIVVSSLVNKAVNLGAICRLCDCLGVGALTLNDLSVLENPQFKTVSVTAEKWMPMVEVRVEDIIEYMRYQKKQGYTLIGLEQTDESVELNSDLKFPEKSLILLGKEREGIPGEFLAELDICIEIKQAGVIRSMNIQTATAIICHSYSIQHI